MFGLLFQAHYSASLLIKLRHAKFVWFWNVGQKDLSMAVASPELVNKIRYAVGNKVIA